MRSDPNAKLEELDSEIERRCKALTKAKKERLRKEKEEKAKELKALEEGAKFDQETFEEGSEGEEMANNGANRALREFAVPSSVMRSSIERPTVAANNFEIKPSLIQMVQQSQFGGGVIEDVNAHLTNFLEICDTIKMNGVTDDAIRLRLFPFSLRDKAKTWLISQAPGSITTWDQLIGIFLAKYFPPGKTAKLRNDITSFTQFEGETLYEAWERFKDLQRKCPHHGIPDWLIVQTFYNGLATQMRSTIDAAAGGALMNKNTVDAYDLLEEMAANNYHWSNERSVTKRVAGVHDMDGYSLLASKVDAIAKTLERVNINALSSHPIGCESCGGNHHNSECHRVEQVHFVSNPNMQQNNPYSNTYNPGWRNHPNLAWGNQGNQGGNQRQPYQTNFQGRNQNQAPLENKPSYEAALEKFIGATAERFDKLEKQYDKLESKVDQIASQNRNLEMQVGQLASSLNTRAQGTLPSQTEVNPIEHCKAITVKFCGQIKEMDGEIIVSDEQQNIILEDTSSKEEREDEEEQKEVSTPPQIQPYVPPIPFPQRLKMSKLDKLYENFLNAFKRLHINIPFADIIAQMPKYMKCLKELLSNRQNLEGIEVIALTEECSAIIQRKIPPKLEDPGSFSIPCAINNFNFDKALCDLGAGVSLMPLTIWRKLKLGKLTPTKISLQLADKSIKHPVGIIENVLVKVGKFYIPVDFIVLDMKEDTEIPLILGRPFLATAGALIDVKNGKLLLRVEEEEEEFIIAKPIKSPSFQESCKKVDVIDEGAKKVVKKKHPKKPPDENVKKIFSENFKDSHLKSHVNGDFVPKRMIQTFYDPP